MNNRNLPIAIIGAGPVGLAAAAHLAKRGIPFHLFDMAQTVAGNINSWAHVRVFSPWKYNIDKAAAELLSTTSWTAPDPGVLPTGQELLDQYFRPLAEHPLIRPNIHLNTKVLSVGRKGLDKVKTAGRATKPFNITVRTPEGIRYYEARAILDASGTWNQPNPIGSGGMYAAGELEAREHIVYGIPDVKHDQLERYKNKRVLVVGSGHSAVNVLLDLAELQKSHPQTRLHWVLRKRDMSTVYGGGADDALEARGALGVQIKELVNSGKLQVFTPLHILKLETGPKGIRVEGELDGLPHQIESIDEIISNTGSRPDLEMIREIRTNIDSSIESVAELAELIDPNIHSCGTVRPHGEKELRHPEENFYIVGSKSYGRAPTFLMATGYEQVRSIVAHLDGDIEAAKNVELNLPETGVCSSQLTISTSCCASESETSVASGCC